jgi:hypothetical protein
MITVPQVCKAIGVEPRKNITWSVGDIMQARYAAEFGHQPMKDNRPKTNGGGSHCFALYPPDWFDLIANEIKKQDYIASNQFDMFQ